MAVRKIRFIANPTQEAFIYSRAEADLFSCRMGEGKSTALVFSNVHHTLLNPGAKWCFIRDTWVNLRDTTLVEFFKWFTPGEFGDWKEVERKWVWKAEQIGLIGEISMLGITDAKDAQKLQSREFAGCAIDEPAPAAESGGVPEFVFDMALTRMRQPGMKWYAMKLAQNSSDEDHWTYRRFVKPGYPGDAATELPPKQKPGFKLFRTAAPENLSHLPAGYYQGIERRYRESGHEDLANRFAKGEFGFQQVGKPVTPEFSKALHCVNGLRPMDVELKLLWDFGANHPCCTFSQSTPMGHWNILESYVGDGDVGALELIADVVGPRIRESYGGLPIHHCGDPAGTHREQSSARNSCVKVIKQELGGRWTSGPKDLADGIHPLRRVLGLNRNGTGLVQVDEVMAAPVYKALRGGWHYPIHNTGHVSTQPKKNIHSHPGDTMRYGAAVHFPGGIAKERGNVVAAGGSTGPRYFPHRHNGPSASELLRLTRPDVPSVPEDGSTLPAPPLVTDRRI